jgi:hypothetical protein
MEHLLVSPQANDVTRIRQFLLAFFGEANPIQYIHTTVSMTYYSTVKGTSTVVLEHCTFLLIYVLSYLLLEYTHVTIGFLFACSPVYRSVPQRPQQAVLQIPPLLLQDPSTSTLVQICVHNATTVHWFMLYVICKLIKHFRTQKVGLTRVDHVNHCASACFTREIQ